VLQETWHNADGTTQNTRNYGYDAAGNLTSAGNNYGTATMAYWDR
jgi:hypothetical protein